MFQLSKNQTVKITMQIDSLLIKKNHEQNMKRQKLDIRIMICLIITAKLYK